MNTSSIRCNEIDGVADELNVGIRQFGVHRYGDDFLIYILGHRQRVSALKVRQQVVGEVLYAILYVALLESLFHQVAFAVEYLQGEDMGHDVMLVIHGNESHIGVVFQPAGVFHGNLAALGGKLTLEAR